MTPYKYPLFTCSNLAHISSNYVTSHASVLQALEPASYVQAQLYPEWVKAMDFKLDALDRNGTWILTSLPKGKRALTFKWAYKTKYSPDGLIC